MATIARYWAVTDLETTGLREGTHEIVQIARVVVDPVNRRIVPALTVNQYVKPTRWDQRNPKAMEINGLTREKLDAEGIDLYVALGDWCRGLNWEETAVAAWGNDFELKFLTEAFETTRRVVPFPYKTLDIRSLAHLRRAQRNQVDYLSLGEACEYYGVPFDSDKAHDALYDATKTAELTIELLRS